MTDTASYTYDLDTPIGQVRLTIGDTVDEDGAAFFSDGELQALLTGQNGSVPFASVQALRIWSRRLSTLPKQQIGDYTYDPGITAKNLTAVADQLAVELGDEADDPVVGEFGGELWVRD